MFDQIRSKLLGFEVEESDRSIEQGGHFICNLCISECFGTRQRIDAVRWFGSSQHFCGNICDVSAINEVASGNLQCSRRIHLGL